jgi:predicted DNA-binding transcriptional regulator YafY
MSNRKAHFASALRIFDLVLYLHRRRTSCTVKQAAEHLEVHAKTVLRYVAALQSRLVDDDGRPLISVEHRGRTPHVVVTGPLFGSDAHVFDYASLFLAMRMLDFADGQLQEGLARVAAGVAPRIQRQDLLAKFSRKFFVYHSGPHTEPDREVMAEILSGLVNERRLAVRYHSWPKAKTVEPMALAIYKEGLYLIARMPGKPNFFTLAVPSIEAVEYLPREKFRMPAHWSPEKYRGDAFGMMPGALAPVRLRAAGFLGRYFATRSWHASQKVTALPGGELRVTMRVSHSPELVAWICSFGPDLVVEAPAGLRQEVAARLAAGVAKYAG